MICHALLCVGDVVIVYRHVRLVGDVANVDARLHHRCLEGEAAADQEGHHVWVFGPGGGGVADGGVAPTPEPPQFRHPRTCSEDP